MIIGFAQILVGVGNFLVLPIVTRLLGTHDYGIWIEVSVTVNLLTHLVVLGLSTAMLRFLPSKADRKEISEQFFTIFFFVTFFSLVLAGLMALFSEAIAGTLFGDPGLALVATLAGVLIPLSAINGLTTAYFRAVDKVKTYVLLSVLSAFSQLGLILALSSLGLTGVVFAATLSMTLACTVALIIILRQVGFSRPNFSLLRPNLKFSLPLTPNAIINWVTESSDRYLVASILGLSYVGVYSAAWGIGSVVFLFVTPIQMVLYPTMSKLYDGNRLDDVKAYLGRSVRYFLMLTIPAVAGLAVLAEPILVVMTTPEFAAGAAVVPFIALSSLLAGVSIMVTTILLLVKKTHLNLAVYAIPAVLNVALVIIATPSLGIVGTAMASTATYIVMLWLSVKVSFKHIRFPLDWPCVVKSLASSAFMALAILALSPDSLFEIILSIGVGLAIYSVAMVLSRGVEREELDFAKAFVQRAIHRE